VAHLRDLKRIDEYAHVVLSAHLDDAALAFGGTIAALTAKKRPVLVVTVCAGIPNPLARPNKLAKELTASNPVEWVLARRREEARAMAELDADYYLDTALDAIFRHPKDYASRKALFGKPGQKDSLHTHAFGLAALLAHLASTDAAFYAPLGIGGHADHRIVCAAAMRAFPRERTYFYEDFPYLRDEGAIDARRNELEAMGFPLERQPKPRSITGTLAKKRRAVAAYKSQVDGLFGSPTFMRRALREQTTEALWRVATR
jgi:LmbE family N-acetylglucosaminyl deacetylase